MSIDKVLDHVASLGVRLEKMEKVLASETNRTSDAINLVQKTLLGRNTPSAAFGWDGSRESMVYSLPAREKLKGIGKVKSKTGEELDFTQFLKATHDAMTGYESRDTAWGGGREKAINYLKTIGSEPIEKTALAENSGATGGYTVPIEFVNKLMAYEAEDEFAASKCFKVPMQSREFTIPALDQTMTPTAGQSAFFSAISWKWGTAEGGTINDTEPKYKQISQIAGDLMFTATSSNQLLQDSPLALDTMLTTLFRRGMGWAKDYYILRGSGTGGEPLGVTNSAALFSESRATASTFSMADVADMRARLLPQHANNACWCMHPQVLGKLIAMQDSANGRLVWLNQFPMLGHQEGGGLAGVLPIKLLGLPLHVTEKLPALGSANDVLLVDFSQYILGERMALQIEVSRDRLFEKNQTMWRIIERWTGRPWPSATIIMSDGSYQMSAFVGLAA